MGKRLVKRNMAPVAKPAADAAVVVEDESPNTVVTEEACSGTIYKPIKLPSGKLEFQCTTCPTVGTIYVDDPDAYDERMRKDLLTARGWTADPALLCRWCTNRQHRNGKSNQN